MVLIALICVIDLDLQQQQIKLSFEQHDKIASYCKAQKKRADSVVCNIST